MVQNTEDSVRSFGQRICNVLYSAHSKSPTVLRSYSNHSPCFKYGTIYDMQIFTASPCIKTLGGGPPKAATVVHCTIMPGFSGRDYSIYPHHAMQNNNNTPTKTTSCCGRGDTVALTLLLSSDEVGTEAELVLLVVVAATGRERGRGPRGSRTRMMVS